MWNKLPLTSVLSGYFCSDMRSKHEFIDVARAEGEILNISENCFLRAINHKHDFIQWDICLSDYCRCFSAPTFSNAVAVYMIKYSLKAAESSTWVQRRDTKRCLPTMPFISMWSEQKMTSWVNGKLRCVMKMENLCLYNLTSMHTGQNEP